MTKGLLSSASLWRWNSSKAERLEKHWNGIIVLRQSHPVDRYTGLVHENSEEFKTTVRGSKRRVKMKGCVIIVTLLRRAGNSNNEVHVECQGIKCHRKMSLMTNVHCAVTLDQTHRDIQKTVPQIQIANNLLMICLRPFMRTKQKTCMS